MKLAIRATALLLLLLPVAASAQGPTFPSDDSVYRAATCGGVESTDPRRDQAGANDSRDIVGSAGLPALLSYTDGTYVFLRMRLDADPSRPGMEFEPFGWGFEMDTDGDLSTYEYLILLDGVSSTEVVTLSRNSVTGMVGDPADRADTPPLTAYPAATHARATPAGSSIGGAGSPDWFVTIALPIDDLVSAGIPLGFTIVWAGTSASANSLDKDIACHDAATGSPVLQDIPVDPTPIGPSVSVDAPSDGSMVTTDPAVIRGRATPGAVVTVTIDSGSSVTVTADAMGNWSYTPPAALGDGMHTVVASVTDSGSHTATDTVTFTVLTTFTDTDGDGIPDLLECPTGTTPCPDTDGDGTPDVDDTDDDGDGIPTARECGGGTPCPDFDLDGTPDYLDADDDGDGVQTRFERPDPNMDGDPSDARDTDMDSMPDYLDTDDDGDGVATALEGRDPNGDGDPMDARNTDGDLLADYLDADDDGDGIPTETERVDSAALSPPNENVDGDALLNWLDADADGDGISDRAEGRGDLDSDGIPNYLDPDSAPLDTDMDGLSDDEECPTLPCRDTDMDGMPDAMDPDDDGDGVPTATELAFGDTDGDTIDDHLDDDDDGDGIPTRDERPGDADQDTDSDRVPNHLDADDDGDSIPTATERTDETALGGDVDEDGAPAWLDTDSDGDGLSDAMEGTGDANGDGVPDYLDASASALDTDGDGVPDAIECPSTPCRDTDMDGVPDAMDTDDDGDGVPTRDERPDGMDRDSDRDGVPDHLDSDDDGDGVLTATERPAGADVDTDGDGLPNHRDSDDDGDSVPTVRERDGGLDTDTDGDGTPDYLDSDDDGDGIPTLSEVTDGDALTPPDDDVDGDGDESWRDLDADGDGVPDADEGREDGDADGIPNYLDPEDGRPGLVGGALCSASPTGSGGGAPLGLALLLFGAALLYARRRRLARWAAVGGALACVTASLVSSNAAAQAVHLDQYRAAETAEDGFAVSRPDDLGHLRFGAQLQLDYALNPLVFERPAGDASDELAPVVEHQLAAHVVGALGLFDRLVLFAGLPVTLVMEGDTIPGAPTADGAGLGDLYVGARGRIWGEREDPFSIGAQLTGTFPTAQAASAAQRFLGEDGMTLHPEILAEGRVEGVRITGNLGARFRLTDRARFQSGAAGSLLDVSHELTWGLGVTVPIVEDLLDAHAEAYGTTTFESFGDRATSPIEAIAGVTLWPMEGLRVGLAAGPGLARGYGSPDFRGVLTVGWAEPAPSATAEAAREPEPEPGRGDRDGDGFSDDDDPCPTEAEDRDSYEDDDGCPDPDNDADGILDLNDGAPMEPEDRDGWQDDDGVPDPDNDGDQVPDVDDECPLEAEDRDGFADENGCPDPDNDGDTLLDGDDECPLEPGAVEARGCPRSVRLDTETGRIVILQRVEFATNRDVILSQSEPILEEVRAVLAVNPQLRRIRVEGHTDDRGRDDRNMDLSVRRARSVLRWLTEHGIEASRLEGFGCGELHPVEDNATNEGRQANRRVEFLVRDPAPPGGAALREGCTATE